ncbi:Hypothetical predicted protein [Mytilus galloprovincialis]|uniref:Uncharacterized protein n=1 Tax=Mytilus galloprovincialis TaxID=29158 RepID=A0A8B6ENL3_MYTGA|nr:Hypothetical predicted protein [Mytilus galloprovincialis]
MAKSDTDSEVQSNTSPSISPSLPSQPPIMFTTTEGQSVNLSEVLKHTIASSDFVDCFGPLIGNVVKASVDSALSNYVSNLEAKIEKQEQIISDLMKRKLKNNPDKTVMTEDLTQYRQYLMKKLNDVRKRHEIDSFWTMDGHIFAKMTPEATKKFIGGMKDLNELFFLTNNVLSKTHIFTDYVIK